MPYINSKFILPIITIISLIIIFYNQVSLIVNEDGSYNIPMAVSTSGAKNKKTAVDTEESI